MGLPDIRTFLHTRCRFRLRGGKEVFGVVWESSTQAGQPLCFASIGEYERALREPQLPINTIAMPAEEILMAERLVD